MLISTLFLYLFFILFFLSAGFVFYMKISEGIKGGISKGDWWLGLVDNIIVFGLCISDCQ